MKVLVTGAAGFIGMHVSEALAQRGEEVVGIDNLNDYYDPGLKLARLEQLRPLAQFSFQKLDISDRVAMAALFDVERFDHVVHLAAQAGVRYSIENPHAYADSNLIGFLNVLEGCRQSKVKHLVYASSSSVYGGNTKMPFSEVDSVDHPVSLYAATKKANELMAHTYSHLYDIPTTGLRFFTVYGPWGRPDMAYFSFTRDILAGVPIKVFNHGKCKRDFTFIDDIVAGVIGAIDHAPTANQAVDRRNLDPGVSSAPFRVLNIGNSEPVDLEIFISEIEAALGMVAVRQYLPMQPGDVEATYADVSRLEDLTNIRPSTTIRSGISAFVKWYRKYYITKTNKKIASST